MHGQVENLTSIAESRLETIHLLEKELERQALEAAAVAAAHSGAGGAGRLRDGRRIPGGAGLPSFTLPTIVYAGLLGSIILAIVVYRVYRIVQMEVRDHKNALLRSRSGSNNSGGHHQHHSHNHPSHSHPSHRHRRDSSASMLPSHSLSPTNASLLSISAGDSRLDASALSSSSSADLQSPSRLENDEPSPQQCYKRSQPPASPDSRLMHV